MKILVKLFLILALFWGTRNFCHRQTEGFEVTRIISPLAPSSTWEIAQDKEYLRTVFSQPFTYLGSGGQCYAFLSQDQQIVLKLYKMHHLRQYPLLHRIALPGILDTLRLRFLSSQQQKLDRIFSSSALAYTTLREETGLLSLKLNPEPQLEDVYMTLIDRIGISHTIPLSTIPFALQKRAKKPFKALRTHLRSKNLEASKKIVEEIYTCLVARYAKGVKDLDPALRRNIGLLSDRAIAIDIGSFTPAVMTAEEQKEELIKDTRRMHLWLHKRSPELAAHLDALINGF